MLAATLSLILITCIDAFAPNGIRSFTKEVQSLPKSIVPLTSSASASALLIPGAAQAFETLDDVEVAELPPVYVPILFAIVILVGVGLLTSSLGDVYNEEASLGLQSGARAKKERERSRSSYFKRSD